MEETISSVSGGLIPSSDNFLNGDNKGQAMCDCFNRDFEVIKGKLYGEYDGDFHKYSDDSYSYCPICGENLQPERSKREDLELIYKEPDFEKMKLENPTLYAKFEAAKEVLRCGALNS